jgi:hypothetical protein
LERLPVIARNRISILEITAYVPWPIGGSWDASAGFDPVIAEFNSISDNQLAL